MQSSSHSITPAIAPNDRWENLKVSRDPVEELGSCLELIKAHFEEMSKRLNTEGAHGYEVSSSGQLSYLKQYLQQSNRVVECNTISGLWRLLDHRLSQLSIAQNGSLLAREALAEFIEQTPFLEFCSGAHAAPGSPEVLDMFTRGNLPRHSLAKIGSEEKLALTPFGALLHYFHIHTPAADAHSMRLRVFRSFFKDLAAKLDSPLHYLSFGAGNGYEFEYLKNGNKLFASATLIGVNHQSLTDTAAVLEGIGAPSPRLVSTDAKQLLVTGSKLKSVLSEVSGMMDVVSCLGTLDYIPKKGEAESLVIESLKTQLDCIKPGGFLIASFIMNGNPHKAVLRDLLNWKLNHRSIDDISKIAAELNLKPFEVENEVYRQGVPGLSASIPTKLGRGCYAIVNIDPLRVNTFLVIRKE